MPKSPTSSELISPEYLAEQQRLHADPRGYGGRGSKWADVVVELILLTNAQRVLDYGCGQGTLGQRVLGDGVFADGSEPRWVDYDPAIAHAAHLPQGDFDLVVCSDVLEHIEEDKIDAVLRHLRALTSEGGQVFTVISTVETAKTLSDGRQAHILLHDQRWWTAKMLDAGLQDCQQYLENKKPEKQLVNLWRPI